jgi:hypothetical protein
MYGHEPKSLACLNEKGRDVRVDVGELALPNMKKKLQCRGLSSATPINVMEYFSQTVPYSSQREVQYQCSPYIAEFWCTLSNIGFLFVGWKNKKIAIFGAGLASILSHSIPLNCLLHLDKLAALWAASSLIPYAYHVFQFKPHMTVGLTLLVITLNAFDYVIANKFPITRPWTHVIWHIGAATYANWIMGKPSNSANSPHIPSQIYL